MFLDAHCWRCFSQNFSQISKNNFLEPKKWFLMLFFFANCWRCSYEFKFLSFGFDFSHGRIKNGKYQINYVIETFNLFKVPITTTRKWMLCIFIISVFVS